MGKKLNRLLSVLLVIVITVILTMGPAKQVEAANASNAIAWGIDVSKHNTSINWAAVAQSGASFTFIKAGSTNTGMDPYFQGNINGANSAGLKVGVYLYSYATNAEEAVNEANLLLSWIEPYTVSFPVVYDIENKAQSKLSQAKLQELINAFCSTISAAGYYPMVYSSKNWFERKIGGTGYDKWVAQYNDQLEYGGASFWQNSSHASVDGVPTRVDTNYQFKDYSQIIVCDGFAEREGGTRFYSGYRMQKGWVEWAGTRFYIGESGYVQKNMWFQDETGLYFLGGDGGVLRGQVDLEGNSFYFDEAGRRMTGWVTVDGRNFFYSPETGTMVRGWVTDETGRYFMSTKDGHMLVSDVTIEGQNYYFGDNGIMATGLVSKPDGAVYYYDETGVQVMNTQITLGENTYNIDKNGVVTESVNY